MADSNGPGRLYRLIRTVFPRFYLRLQARKPYHHDIFFDFIPKLVSKDQCAMDVGVNRGVYSYWLSRSSRHVFGFEPNPTLARELRRTLPGNCTLHEVEVSDFSGQRILHIPVNDGLATFQPDNPNVAGKSGAGMVETPVQVKRLDEIDLPIVKLIKIDVEGHEIEVLKGAAQLMARSRPRVFIEIKSENRAGADQMIFGYFQNMNYVACVLSSGGLVRLNLQDSSSFTGEKGGNVLFLPKEDELLVGLAV